MNLFHSLEEHAELFLEVLHERMQHQIAAFGGADERLKEIVATLRAHLEPVVEAVIEPIVELVTEPAAEPVVAPVAEAPQATE